MLTAYQPDTVTEHFKAFALHPITRIKDGRPFGYGTEYPVEMTAEGMAHLYWRPSRFIVTKLEITSENFGALTHTQLPQAGAFRADKATELLWSIGGMVITELRIGPASEASSPAIVGSFQLRPEAVCFADGKDGIWYPWLNVIAAAHNTPYDLTASNVKMEGATEVGSFEIFGKHNGPLYQPPGQLSTITHARIEIDFAPWRFSP